MADHARPYFVICAFYGMKKPTFTDPRKRTHPHGEIKIYASRFRGCLMFFVTANKRNFKPRTEDHVSYGKVINV